MDNEKNTVINIVPTDKDTIIHFLEGRAPDPLNKCGMRIEGDINSVTNFIQSGNHVLDKSKTIIFFNEEEMSIALHNNIGEDARVALYVFGKLKPYPELEAFGINSSKRFRLQELEKFIRMNRIFFSDAEEHAKICTDLRSFTAKVEQHILNESDQRGNKNNQHQKIVKTDLMTDFKLRISLFKGMPPLTFRVEICYDVTEGSTMLWLESVELFELQKQAVLTAFDLHKKEYKKDGFTVIFE